MRATSAALVAMVFAGSAIATFPAAKRSPITPDPITAATRKGFQASLAAVRTSKEYFGFEPVISHWYGSFNSEALFLATPPRCSNSKATQVKPRVVVSVIDLATFLSGANTPAPQGGPLPLYGSIQWARLNDGLLPLV